jgi:hypothetical protein
MRQILADLAKHSDGEQYNHVDISKSVIVYTCKNMDYLSIQVIDSKLEIYWTGDLRIVNKSQGDSFLEPDPEKILKEAERAVAKYIKNN